MAGSSNSSEGEIVIIPLISGEQEQHSTSTNDEISSSDDLPSGVNPLLMLVTFMFYLSLATFIATTKIHHIHILEFDLWKWCLLLTIIFLGMGFIIFFIQGFWREVTFASDKTIRDLASDIALGRFAFVFLHVLIVFIVWMSLFNRRVSSKTAALILHYITKTLAAYLIASFLWTLKMMLVVAAASKFRIKDFREKIADALSNKYLLKALSKPPPVTVPRTRAAATAAGGPHRNSFRRYIPSISCFGEGMPVSYSGVHVTTTVLRHLSRFFPQRDKRCDLVVSEGSKGLEELRVHVKRLITKKENKITKKENKIIKDLSYPTVLFLTHNVLETELSIINNPIDDDDIKRQTDFKITNEWEAETAANRIFSNVAPTDPKYMTDDELSRILSNKEDVETLYSQVHGTDDPSGRRISKIALRQWVLKVFREHKALTSSSKYHKAVVNQLDQFVQCVLILLVFIIWLLLIGYPTPRIQLLLSLLLGASFIFGNTCKDIFEGIIYVVFMHPFDIGDLCVVDGGQVLVVEGGDIYSTAFSEVDTDEKVFYPNSLLCSKPIKNYTRSPDMKETLEIIIDNPGQQLQDQKEIIERRIVEYLKSQPEQWQPCPVLYEMKETVDADKLTIVLHCFRKMSLQNWKERVSRKNMLEKEIKKITKGLSVAEQATSSRRYVTRVR